MEDKQANRQVVDDIVRRAQAGDQSAFAELYERHYDQIFRYVSFKCGNQLEAEDLTGEVFLRMLESIDKFRFQGFPFTSWLYRIAHNLVVDNFRRKGRKPTVPLDKVLHFSGGADGEMEIQAQISWSMREVVEAMTNLTDLQREVITLRFVAGLSIAETADAVGRRDNAVKALQHAGIRKLRNVMTHPGPFSVATPEPET
jgi:RNA polymerase sigma-70 factor (ECF subfamily)